MFPWDIFYLLVPILMAFYLNEYREELLKLIKLQFYQNYFSISDTTKPHKELFVYIPSARDHFDHREAIRESWASNLSSKIGLKFVMGLDTCGEPEDYLMDPFSCQHWKMPLLDDLNDDLRLAVIIEKSELKLEDNVFTREYLEFIILHPVLLLELGVHKVCRSSAVSIILLEATSKKLITSVDFSELNSNESSSISSFYFKKIKKSFLLPRGFRGFLKLERIESGSSDCDFDSWDFPWETKLNSSDVIHFLPYPPPIPSSTYFDINLWQKRIVTLINFSFEIKEKNDLRKKIKKKEKRLIKIKNNILETNKKLIEENNKYNDLLLLSNFTDVYRNLSLKFLLFGEWLISNFTFNFLLKTDDDSYIDLDKIYNLIQDYKDNNIWFGRFRHHWEVNKFGKWSDPLYSSSHYPRFACGSGYVLSENLVKNLVLNKNSLELYQGEDVSMGIWLAAFKHKIIDEPLWLCENFCLSDMYSIPDLDPNSIKGHWENKVKCGDPCGCD